MFGTELVEMDHDPIVRSVMADSLAAQVEGKAIGSNLQERLNNVVKSEERVKISITRSLRAQDFF